MNHSHNARKWDILFYINHCTSNGWTLYEVHIFIFYQGHTFHDRWGEIIRSALRKIYFSGMIFGTFRGLFHRPRTWFLGSEKVFAEEKGGGPPVAGLILKPTMVQESPKNFFLNFDSTDIVPLVNFLISMLFHNESPFAIQNNLFLFKYSKFSQLFFFPSLCFHFQERNIIWKRALLSELYLVLLKIEWGIKDGCDTGTSKKQENSVPTQTKKSLKTKTARLN